MGASKEKLNLLSAAWLFMTFATLFLIYVNRRVGEERDDLLETSSDVKRLLVACEIERIEKQEIIEKLYRERTIQ